MRRIFVLPILTLLFAGALAANIESDARAALAAAHYFLYDHFAITTDLNFLDASSDGNYTARISNGAVRIDLDRYNDAFPYRTELVPKRLSPEGFDRGKLAHINEEYWYGLRIFVPTTWRVDNSYEVVTQWHGLNTGPPISLRMDNLGVSAGLHGSTQMADHWLLMVPGKHIDLGLISPSVGQWVDWVFRIRWSPDSGGRITVWSNKRWVADVSGPTMYPDTFGPYWKFGIYKSPWRQVPSLIPLQSHRTLYFDNVRIAQGASIAIDSF
jgi:hypothetical protein